MGFLTNLECSECGSTVSGDVPRSNRCKDGGILLARYDLEGVRGKISREDIARGPASLWRYAPLLPVADPDDAVTLGEGWTPLHRANRLASEIGCGELWVKDEGQSPTGTFKDRGAAVALSRYRELGVDTVILNSSGNAGGAFSLYAARAGMRCVSVLPTDVQPSSIKQCHLAGADGVLVPADLWHTAGGIVAEAAELNGWFNVGTMKEPFRTEGKKTMGYEIAEQLGWELPDVIVYPVGGGTGAIAIWKGFDELAALGWAKGDTPRMIVTQYDGCAPIVKAFDEGRDTCEPWGEIDILPGGLKSPTPPAGNQILRLIRETGGGAVAVSTAEALQAVSDLSRLEGIFTCPEAATTLAGLKKAVLSGMVGKGERVVLVNTGSGLKSVPSLPSPGFRTIKVGEDVSACLSERPR